MGKLTYKKYACTRCGKVVSQRTNHYGKTWSFGRVNTCPDCPPWAKYSEFGGGTVWVCLEVEGREEERLKFRLRGNKKAKPGDELPVQMSHSSPPGVSTTLYRITRVEPDGALYGVVVDYGFDEYDGADER